MRYIIIPASYNFPLYTAHSSSQPNWCMNSTFYIASVLCLTKQLNNTGERRVKSSINYNQGSCYYSKLKIGRERPMCRQNPLKHRASKATLSDRAWLHRRNRGHRDALAHTQLSKQSGGKGELFIPHDINKQKVHGNPATQEHLMSHGSCQLPREYKQCHLHFKA